MQICHKILFRGEAYILPVGYHPTSIKKLHFSMIHRILRIMLKVPRGHGRSLRYLSVYDTYKVM